MNKTTTGIYRDFYRQGPSHRDGADVSFRDVVKIFGFKSAIVGQWVSREEQQIAANLFFDALCDLMLILQVPEKVISLNGTLSIAFGKFGKPNVSAHYNSSTRTLALAKNAGPGALAHEYFHAFDHFISPKFIHQAKPDQFASQLWLERQAVIEHPLNNLLEACYQHIFLKPNSDEFSDLFKNSVAADKNLRCYYFASPQEVCARAFEAFVQDNAIKNAFLVSGTKQTLEAKVGLYPQHNERKLIAHHFIKYFSALGDMLEYQSARKSDA